MTTLPEGYTVTIAYDEHDQPQHAELRDSSMGIHVAQALWSQQMERWYDPSGHAPGGNPDQPIDVATTLRKWLEERNLRGDTPAFA